LELANAKTVFRTPYPSSNDNVQFVDTTALLCPAPLAFDPGNTDGYLCTLIIIYPYATLEIDFGKGCFRLDTYAFPDPPRIEADKFQTPTVDSDEGGELKLFVRIGGVWSWWARRFELCGAFTLAKTAFPDKVGSVVLPSVDVVLLDAIQGHDLRVGFIATGAFHPEEVLKVVCGGYEIGDIFQFSFDGEQKTHHRSTSCRVEWLVAR